MKAKIYSQVPGAMIAKRAPPTLREQVLLRRFERDSGNFTLLVFSMEPKNKIVSGVVSHILNEISQDARIVAFGGCFTLESLALLRARGSEIFTLSDFPWTDSRAAEMRAIIASPVKFPT